MGVLNPSTFTILTYRAFEPTEISGLKGWWKADSIDQADNTSVSAWLDSSGNEAHMYQSSATAQPTLQTNELNGYPVVRFDGTNDFMNLTAPFDELPTNTSSVEAVKYSPNGQYIAHLNSSTSPFIFIYKKNGNVFNKLTNPLTLPTGTTYGCSWSPDSTYLVINHSVSPFITIYKRTNDTFTKLSNPATIPNASSSGSGWSYDANYLGVSGGFTSPAGRFYVYKRSGDVFTKIADPAILPSAGDARVTKFSTNDSFVAVASQATPFIFFYSLNKSTDTLTKLNNPVVLPSNEVFSISWLNDEYCAVGFGSSTVRFYKYNGTNFEEDTNLNTAFSVVYSLEYSRDGNYIAIGGQLTPFLKVYSRSGNVYTLLSTPESFANSQCRGATWNNDGNSLLTAHVSAPYIQAYTFDGTILTNLTKLNMFRNVSGSTVFVVKKQNSLATSQYYFWASTPSSGSTRIAFYGGVISTINKIVLGARRLDADGTQLINSITNTSTNFEIASYSLNLTNANGKIFINGKEDLSTTMLTTGTTSNTDSNNILIGSYPSASFLNGDIAEVIAFNRALTTAEIRDVHYYLSAKYNITLAT